MRWKARRIEVLTAVAVLASVTGVGYANSGSEWVDADSADAP